jgi:hypothetical protein
MLLIVNLPGKPFPKRKKGKKESIPAAAAGTGQKETE